LALLHASIVAVSSDSFSGVNAKPAENSTNIFLPGTVRKFFARLRTASSIVRAPKSASALLSEERPVEATVTGASGFVAADALESTDEYFTPLTAAVRASPFAVKFCTTRSLPPKSTTAIMRSGPAFACTNFAAAPRAWIWSGAAIDELSKNKIK
jgi:hypothetical protein